MEFYVDIKTATFNLPFKIGAPSMVFGKNLLKNARQLAGMVDHIEIVLFYTPTLHNFPAVSEIKTLKKLCADEDVSFRFISPPLWRLHPESGKSERNLLIWPSILLKSWKN